MASNKPIIIGVTGATGIVYAARTLEILRSLKVETHLVVSRSAELMRAYESNISREQFESLADHVHSINDVAAVISSGSFKTMGMIIVPCSMRSLAEIASGVTSTLLTRAADVVLKERRRLVLLVRESPLSTIHLRNMQTVTEAGGIIFPPVPAFYTAPSSVDEIVDHSIGRVLDLFDLHTDVFPRWTEEFRRKRLGKDPHNAAHGIS
ncbi:4-hydroxy-3-polyprenylbenzoate decarboxylase [Nitrosomonas sp. PY1]|uniref:UbiX family flavin prenyltransferase n=1 Tax=Nitrosomonas sp. PY1 TaxID=1803906 RepID=UPI001FC8A7AE|nr:UbiX family flavin prenyltransferase [Nitrosomonas sp. PY1]GKS69292.1 4-hydroxy-3-polyprenylbenzoate decarboxylase [Nitrosomonas sp. PY1]